MKLNNGTNNIDYQLNINAYFDDNYYEAIALLENIIISELYPKSPTIQPELF